MSTESTHEIPPGKIEQWLHCRAIEMHPNTSENERKAAKAARERLEKRYAGIEVAAMAQSKDKAAPAALDWGAIFKRAADYAKVWLDEAEAAAKQSSIESQIADVVDGGLAIEVKEGRKKLSFRMDLSSEALADLAELCGDDPADPRWAAAARAFGATAERLFSRVLREDGQ
jgi:hypothetical protein